MTRKQRRLALIGTALGILALAAGLVLSALRDSIVFFNSPTDVVEKQVKPGVRIRIGGMVKEGSIERADDLADSPDLDSEDINIQIENSSVSALEHPRGNQYGRFRRRFLATVGKGQHGKFLCVTRMLLLALK